MCYKPVKNERTSSAFIFCQAAVLGFGKKGSMMELQNLQEALKVEIQIHQVPPLPQYKHTHIGSAMFGVIVITAVPSLSSRGHVFHYTPENPKTFSLFLQKLVTQMKQDPQVCLPHKMLFF